jgi:hypothetical protein
MLLTRMRRYVPLAVWLLIVSSLLLVPLKIISMGYLPPDDALRHAAKAVSDKPWQDILVMRGEFGLDHNAGWHVILGWLHRAAQWDTDTLATFEIVFLFVVFAGSALPWLRRPEAWLVSLLAGFALFPKLLERTMLGRPFALTMAVLVAILFLWREVRDRRPGLGHLLATVALVALAVWIHGTWYLLVLPVAALVLAGRWQPALWLATCWMGGSFLGALLTGHPWQYLGQAVLIFLNSFSHTPLQRLLVSEFAPSDGAPQALLLAGGLILWRRFSPGWQASRLRDPVILLVAITWVMGLKVSRSWWDWGLPALAVWMALELQEDLERWCAPDSLARLCSTAILAAGVFWAATADRSNRWTWSLTQEFLEAENKDLAGWLPEPGGIVYNDDMRIFYTTFFKNPRADWKYMLGFEPSFMPLADLQTYRQIQLAYDDFRPYKPWVKKLRPQDRLILMEPFAAPTASATMNELEWRRAVKSMWIGRLPRGTNSPAPPNSPAPASR